MPVFFGVEVMQQQDYQLENIMKDIDSLILDKLGDGSKRTAWNILLCLQAMHDVDHNLTRVEISKGLQRLKRRKMVVNDGSIWRRKLKA